MQEVPTNFRQGVVVSSDSCHQRADRGRFHYQLDSAEATHHQLRHQLNIVPDTLESNEEQFTVFATDYYRLTNGKRHSAFDTSD